MREISFRGKEEGSRVWYYGGYSKQGDKSFITSIGEDRISYTIYLREVDSKTVGQFTGLKDKNGVEMYEGDIVKVSDFGYNTKVGKIIYNEKVALYNVVAPLFVCALGCYADGTAYIEVIGNIYDNPELLEVEE